MHRPPLGRRPNNVCLFIRRNSRPPVMLITSSRNLREPISAEYRSSILESVSPWAPGPHQIRTVQPRTLTAMASENPNVYEGLVIFKFSHATESIEIDLPRQCWLCGGRPVQRCELGGGGAVAEDKSMVHDISRAGRSRRATDARSPNLDAFIKPVDQSTTWSRGRERFAYHDHE